MHAFVVLGLVFSIPSQEIGLGKRLQNDLFCVKWDIKPQLSQFFGVTPGSARSLQHWDLWSSFFYRLDT